MRDAITLKELAAIILRRGKMVIVTALVFAVILAGWGVAGALTDSGSDKTEEEIQEELELHLEKKREAEQLLGILQKQLDQKREYLENCPLMQLDATQVAVVSVNFSVTELQEDDFQRVYEIQGTPVDFIISSVLNHYSILWRSANLETVLTDDYSDEHWRKIVFLEGASSGVLSVKVYGKTEEEATATAQKVCQYMYDIIPSVVQNTFPHTLKELNRASKTVNSAEVATEQTKTLAELEDLSAKVEEAQLKLEGIQAQAPIVETQGGFSLRDLVKSVVIGGVLGVALSVIWIIISVIFGDRVMLGSQLESVIGVPMLASVLKKKDWLNRLADKILGQRVWAEESQALKYLSNAMALRAQKGERIALLTSLSGKTVVQEVQGIKTELEERGYTVSFVADASCAPETLEQLAVCDSVLLVERCDKSVNNAVLQIVALAKEQDKPLRGFVLV